MLPQHKTAFYENPPPLRGLREILEPSTTGMVNTGKACLWCGDALWRAASDTNEPACLSPRCAERRGKVDTGITGHDYELQRRNTQRLSEIQAATGLRINPDAWAKWRPTKETAGEIPGIALAVCLATDGVVAWFKLLAATARPQGASENNLLSTTVGIIPTQLPGTRAHGKDGIGDEAASLNSSLGPYFLGHVHRFEWQDGKGATQVGCPPSAFAKDKVKAFRAKVKQKTKAEKLDDLLSAI